MTEIDARCNRLLDDRLAYEKANLRLLRRAQAYFSMWQNQNNQTERFKALFQQLEEDMMHNGHIMEALHLQDQVEAITSTNNYIDLTLMSTEVDSD